MRAAYYERTGAAKDVLTIGELPNPVVIAYQAHGYWVFRGKAHAPAEHGPYATAPTLAVPIAGRSST